MKILLITNHSYMFWQFRRELVQQLVADHEVVLSMPFVGHEDDFSTMGIRCIETDVDRRGINPLRDLKLLNTYRKLLLAEKPDLVVTYSIKPNVYAGFACRCLGIPYCANVQGLGTAFEKPGLKQFVTELYRIALKRAKVVFFENQGNAALFLKNRIISKDKIYVLHGAGINLSHYTCKEYPDDRQTRFLYLGRIMKEKGIDELFSAMERLHAQRGNSVILDLVGFFEDEYKDRVEDLVQKGIARFHGFQSEPRPYYEAAHCVVLPSWHEGMSNVLLEAAATARPVITSDIPGCMEAVTDGISGYLCRVKEIESLFEKMVAFCDLPYEERREMGLRGRELMEHNFDKEKVVAETIYQMMK